MVRCLAVWPKQATANSARATWPAATRAQEPRADRGACWVCRRVAAAGQRGSEVAMARNRRAEEGGATVVRLAEAAAARRRPRTAAPQPAARNPQFEGLLCRAVAERLLVEV